MQLRPLQLANITLRQELPMTEINAGSLAAIGGIEYFFFYCIK
jgi:hypothetical protein